MNETALYRKYRPAAFKDVLGQDQVVKVLEGAIREGNIAHAYLFAGSRGTGKTSVARIFARAIGTSDKDLYEMDAASNRGIDEIRAVREAVHLLPFESKYKVYIVDEAHMLTREAFNALLKTLEEPPSHVIFILATTEINKLPETIVSRCQTFVFKKPTERVLKAMIERVAQQEGYVLENASAELIAVLAEGSFRDAHGILQKILATSPDKKISKAEVELVTGAPKSTLVNDFLRALADGKGPAALEVLQAADKENVEVKLFLKLVLGKVRAVLLLRYAPELAPHLEEEYGPDDFAFLSTLASEKNALHSSMLATLLLAYDQTGRAVIPTLPLEMALLELAEDKKS